MTVPASSRIVQPQGTMGSLDATPNPKPAASPVHLLEGELFRLNSFAVCQKRKAPIHNGGIPVANMGPGIHAADLRMPHVIQPPESAAADVRRVAVAPYDQRC